MTVLIVLLVLTALLLLLLAAMAEGGVYFYYAGLSTAEWLAVGLAGLWLMGLTLLAAKWAKKGGNKGIIAVSLVLAILLSGVFGLSYAVFSDKLGENQSFASTDGEHTIVIRNLSNFAVEWSEVYEMTSPLTMRKLGTVNGALGPSDDLFLWQQDGFYLTIGQKQQYFAFLHQN